MLQRFSKLGNLYILLSIKLRSCRTARLGGLLKNMNPKASPTLPGCLGFSVCALNFLSCFVILSQMLSQSGRLHYYAVLANFRSL